MGRRQMSLPVAAKIALATAGAIPGEPASPVPPGALWLGTICTSTARDLVDSQNVVLVASKGMLGGTGLLVCPMGGRLERVLPRWDAFPYAKGMEVHFTP